MADHMRIDYACPECGTALHEVGRLHAELVRNRDEYNRLAENRALLRAELEQARAREAAARPVLDAAFGYWEDGRTGPLANAVVAYRAALEATP